MALVPLSSSERVAGALLFTIGLGCLGQYVAAALVTVPHPFQLEWMEGGMLDVAARIVSGQALYVAPSVEYVPYIYPPLYFVAVAGLSLPLGLDLPTARLVSLIATLVASGVLARWTWRESRSSILTAASVALWLASDRLTGGWLQLARVDALFICLLLAALYTLRFAESRRLAIWSGLLFAAACYTKQTALLVAGPALLLQLGARPRAVGLAAGTMGATLLVATLSHTIASDAWSLYFLFDLPARHQWALGPSVIHLGGALVGILPSLALSILAVARRRADRVALAGMAAPLGGLTFAAVVAYAHTGSHLNAVLPLCLGVALCAPLSVVAVAGARSRTALYLVLSAQLLWLALSGRGALPQAGDVRRGEAFLAWVGELPGEVLMPDHRFLQTRVGKQSFGLGMAARDVLRAPPGDRGRQLLERSLARALTERRFSTIVLSQRDWLAGVVQLAYDPAGEAPPCPTPRTGHPSCPRWVWTPAP